MNNKPNTITYCVMNAFNEPITEQYTNREDVVKQFKAIKIEGYIGIISIGVTYT